MKIWFISGWVHLVVGFVIGWMVFQRPAFVTNMMDRARDWFRRRTGF